ncbi:uncharacterized protein [Amphiura filiformis]|uniref:uncharacterized protein n=1 Tax=Amphiura filiformis TaxID=82378 RepID=UPI003B22456A
MNMIWKSCYAITLYLLLIQVEKGTATSRCYYCYYIEADGEYIPQDDSSIYCKNSPSLAGSVQCLGECVTVDYDYTFTYFGVTSTLRTILRTCTDEFLRRDGSQDVPDPGRCFTGAAFDTWWEEVGEDLSSFTSGSLYDFEESRLDGSVCTCTNDYCASGGRGNSAGNSGSGNGGTVVGASILMVISMLNVVLAAHKLI